MLLRLIAFLIAWTCAASFGQPLPVDPRITSGTLDNGLRYYVIQHANPPGRASVWMHIFSGSLNETDAQRGLAHYLEHMAFNGSEHFPPGTVVKTFESLGLTFGRHQNAFTGFDQTTYQLALPDNSTEKLATALSFMADVNQRLLLEEKEIESERQIILEEKTARKSAQQRLTDYVYARMAPGSIYGERIPIGTEESIRSLKRQDFLDYYSTWYSPANAAIIVVADLDPKVVVAEITRAFSPLPRREVHAPQPIGVRPYEKSFAVVATDPETTRASISINKIAPAHPPVTTEPQLREQFIRNLASTAFRRRVQDKISEGKLSFMGAQAWANNLSGALWQTQALASGEPAKWRDMLKDLATELQRARLHGFTQAEIDAARKDALASLDQRAATEATMPARIVLQRLNGDVASGQAMISSEQTRALAEKLMPTITAQECGDWFAGEFEPSAVMFLVQMPAGKDAPTEQQLLDAGTQALNVTPEKSAADARAEKLMEKLPAPGKATETTTHQASGVEHSWFENGVRSHHRFMDYHKNDATVTITLFGGELLETAENRGLTLAALQAWTQKATQTLSSADIRNLMSGLKVSLGGRTGLDSVQLTVSGSPEDLEVGMQLAHLLLTQPKLEQTAFDRWKTAQLQNLEALEKNPAQKFSTLLSKAVYPDGEVRARPLRKEMIDRITPAAAQAWLDKLIRESPIEVAVVGDISAAKASELVARYIGSLPGRDRISPASFEKLRTLDRPKGPRSIDETIRTETPLANVMVGFYGPDQDNLADCRALGVAAQVLTSRMIQEVREQDQLVYSLAARLNAGSVYPGFGVFRAASPTQPEKTDALAAKITEMFGTFARDGATEQEVETAKRQLAINMDEAMKEPGYWLGVLELMTQEATNLDDVLAAPKALEGVTADAVKAAFNRYYLPENKLEVKLRPVKDPAPQPAK